VRLSDSEAKAITDVLKSFLSNLSNSNKIKLYLFGSRVDDNLKGGDIDLVLIVYNLTTLSLLKKIDYKIISAIKMSPLIGDQKIDLKIISPDDLKMPFFSKIIEKSILLFEI
jgi:predicted nucleotidyltransferase